MVEASGFHLWVMRATFAGLALVIIIANLLPLQMVPRIWAGPDLLLVFALAWSVRRPEFVPPLLLAVVFLMADLLLNRAPGLGAALMLLGCHYMRKNARVLKEIGLLAEWSRVGLLIVILALAERFFMMVFFLPLPPLSLSLFQTVATIVTYPVVVFVSGSIFGVRTSGPREVDPFGAMR